MGESGFKVKSAGKTAGTAVGQSGRPGKPGQRLGGRPAAARASERAPRRPPAPFEPAAEAGPRLGWQEAIRVTVTGLGLDLVDVERAPRGLLRVFIDRIPGQPDVVPGGVQDDGEFVTVEDCERVTRQLQYVLEVEGLDYARLEVSSPGLDRLLRHEADYRRFAGQAVNLTLKEPFEGRKHWQGVLVQGEGQAWSLRFKNGKTEQVLGFTLPEVREARLVPVLDFKGRRAAGKAQDSGCDAAAGAADAVEGG